MLWQLSAFLPSGSPTAAAGPDSAGLKRPDPRVLGSCSGSHWMEVKRRDDIKWSIVKYGARHIQQNCSYLLTCWQKKINTESRILTQILPDGAWRWHMCAAAPSEAFHLLKNDPFLVLLALVHFKVIISSVKESYLLKTIIKARWWKMTMLKIRTGCCYLQVFSGSVWLCQDGKTEPNGFN